MEEHIYSILGLLLFVTLIIALGYVISATILATASIFGKKKEK